MGFFKLFFGLQTVGEYGEELTEEKLYSASINGYRRVLKNVYVPISDGKYTEIDLIMIHSSYIFVIESKNYSGWIFGSEKNKNWTQCLKGGSKTSFYNPIMQNNTHINALSKYLGIEKEKFMSYIVFSQRCVLKKVPEDTYNRLILNRDYLINKIKWRAEDGSFNFNLQQVDYIYDRLQPLTNVDPNIKNQHIQRLNQNYRK